jgi:tripeptidyl-peptidase I
MNAGLYDTVGRGYPDVAAQSNAIFVVNSGQSSVNGVSFEFDTGMSALIFGTLVSNINNIRLGQGRAPMGFLNPWIYREGAEALADITNGHDWGCTSALPGSQWNAVPGWDPVSGFGTPDFGVMQNSWVP